MQKTMDVSRLCQQYIKQNVFICAALFFIGLIAMSVTYINVLLTPLIVGTAYGLILENLEIQIWKRVSVNAPESLPTFFMSVSGFRFLSAIAILFVYYLVAGRETMLIFVLVFAVFYLAILLHHVLFFLNRKQTVQANDGRDIK